MRGWWLALAVACGPESVEVGDSAEPTPGLTDDFPADWASFEDEVRKLVNRERLVGGSCGGQPMRASEPLEMDAVLRSVAREYSRRMAEEGFFDHVDPQGTTPEDRVLAAGWNGSPPIGENIAAGYPTPAAVVAGWMDSPGHCANILEPSYGVIGIGYYFREDDPERVGHYWTQNFGGSR